MFENINSKQPTVKLPAVSSTVSRYVDVNDMRYLNKVEKYSPDLRRLATGLVQSCEGKYRLECSVEKIFNYVQGDVKYVGDPIGLELVQSPIETMMNGGDCEDLSILLSSLLSNIAIKSALVKVPNHMYVMACDLGDLKGYSTKSYETFNKRISLKKKGKYFQLI